MPRADYDEIKRKYAEYVRLFKSKEAEKLSDYVVDDVQVRISSSPDSNDSLDRIEGLKVFVSTYPETDVLQQALYSYNCALKGNEAQQMSHIICESCNYVEGQEEMEAFYYCILAANHWIKTEEGWKMNEVHMDVYPFYWTSEEILNHFRQTWFFGTKLALPDDGRVPAIEGEFDLPWERIPDGEDVLTEVEKVKECYARYFLSADYLVTVNRCTSSSRHLDTNSKRYGENEGIRQILSGLRYKRMKDRYWAHPLRFESITFNEDHTWCRCRIYRVFGWKQRSHEYVWTRSNIDIEHMVTSGYQEFVKEDGVWKIACDARQILGLYDIGPYPENLYGDRI